MLGTRDEIETNSFIKLKLTFFLGLGVGPAEHGLRSTEARIFPEISDTQSLVLSKQTGICS